MRDVLTIREAVQRSKDEGVPVSEYTLRRWGKDGSHSDPAGRNKDAAILAAPGGVSDLRGRLRQRPRHPGGISRDSPG